MKHIWSSQNDQFELQSYGLRYGLMMDKESEAVFMEWVTEQERKLRVTHNCDVLVAGGGVAGIAAALAAARNGAQVILIDKQCLLGGLGTLGLVTVYLPLCDGKGHQVSFGIAEELLRLSIRYGCERFYPRAWLENGTPEEKKEQRFQAQYNPHLFAISVEQLLLQAGVKLLYDTRICGILKDAQRIQAVIVENVDGRTAITANAVVDATGNADICAYSGEKTHCFDKNVDAAWYYYFAGGNYALKMQGFVDLPEADDRQESYAQSRYYSGLDAQDNTQMVITAHQSILHDVLRRRAELPDIVPVSIPVIPQLRMTRRLVGERELDLSDDGRSFEDSVGMISSWRTRGPVYQLPFSCLHGITVKNLLVAGRCISSSDPMWDLTRVIPACAVSGEAAGTAAAMLKTDVSSIKIRELQQRLVSQGVRLYPNEAIETV